MDPREKSCSLKCLRIFFIVCNKIIVLLSVIFVLIFIIKPTLMVFGDDGKEITNSEARRALKLRVILLSMAIPLGCFTIFALFKDHVKFLWFSFAFDIVYSIGMFIFGIHWLELVPTLIIVIVFGFYVQNLSTFQKSLRFDRNLGLSKI